MDDKIYANFVCPSCGPTTIVVEDEERDDSKVSCKTCGTTFQQSWGEVKAEALNEAKGAVETAFADALRRGWKS